ncbi:MAG TPA: asparagine synthase C-terminal domain-containing protein [Bryobacteraceae bacterium]|nr:asparagine synthase C-terminal domain-containing protein [Bryobacteraceae bacterium]
MLEQSEPLRAKVTICGLPIHSREVLSPDSAIFASLHERQDFIQFARQLRGQFAIVIEDGSRTVAITDFGCSRPIFYLRDVAGFKVSTKLADLIGLSRKRMSKEALFFYASRNGIGISPFYSDIHELFPATVTFFDGERKESPSYLDWDDYLETRPVKPADAEERLVEIASSYLRAIARSRGEIACLLSGGADSALISWLLQRIGLDGLSFTADYAWKRYSEFAGASASAKALGVHQERILITAKTRRNAFLAINSERQNAPCANPQTPVMYELARHAVDRGITTLATGDHADALFLGFDRFFRGFPTVTPAYSEAIAALGAQAKLGHLYSEPRRNSGYSELLSIFGCTEDERFAWDNRIYESDCRDMSVFAERAPLHTLQQLDGQIWAGISWQNTFLPVTQAFDNSVEFVSPFYDIEMIKFAMSLPVEYKFRDGLTKALLRDIAHKILGRFIVKRASPNPSRVWRTLPDFRERSLLPAYLRPLYDRLFFRNLVRSGQLWGSIDKIAALGIWLSGQPLVRTETE